MPESLAAPAVRTFALYVTGCDTAVIVATTILFRSQWFSVEPYPDDVWFFKVKEENAKLLQTIVDSAAKTLSPRVGSP